MKVVKCLFHKAFQPKIVTHVKLPTLFFFFIINRPFSPKQSNLKAEFHVTDLNV